MAEDMKKYVGKYKCVKSIDLEKFMKELKLGWIKRKAANAFCTTLEVSYDETSETWNFKTSSLVNKVRVEPAHIIFLTIDLSKKVNWSRNML